MMAIVHILINVSLLGSLLSEMVELRDERCVMAIPGASMLSSTRDGRVSRREANDMLLQRVWRCRSTTSARLSPQRSSFEVPGVSELWPNPWPQEDQPQEVLDAASPT